MPDTDYLADVIEHLTDRIKALEEKTVTHDLRIERGWQYQTEWVYVWCPCGWKTRVMHIVAKDPIAELKREFHEHLRPAATSERGSS